MKTRRWDNLGLRHKGLLVVAPVIFALATSTTSMVLISNAQQHAQGQLAAALTAEKGMNDVLKFSLNIENSMMRFTMTGNNSYLPVGQNSAKQIDGALAKLGTELSGDTRESAAFQTLQGLIMADEQLVPSVEQWAMTPQGQSDMMNSMPGMNMAGTAGAGSASGSGGQQIASGGELVGPLGQLETLTDQIRFQIANVMQTRIQTEVDSAKNNVSHLHSILVIAVIISVIIGVIGGLLGVVFFTVGVERRVGLLSRAARDIEEGRRPDDVPPGNDEIAALGRTLLQAGSMLSERDARLALAMAAGGLTVWEFDPSTEMVTYYGRGGSDDDKIELKVGQGHSVNVDDWLSKVDPTYAVGLKETMARTAIEGRPLNYEYLVHSTYGADRWYVAMGHRQASMNPNDAARLVGVSIDITNRKELEDGLRVAKGTAEQANQAKSEFLSRMSHELRTPLNSILGFGQLLEVDEMTDEQTDNVSHIMRAGRHLLELINEVLDIARIEAGRMDLSVEPVELPAMIEEVVSLMTPIADARSVHVMVDEPSCDQIVMADHQRLRQILINLTSNAVKYNRPDGSIRIACEDRPDSMVRINIVDTGMGIPDERRAQVFVPFDRLGADQTGIEGSGVGLALCKNLVEAMDGSIDFKSRRGIGTTFWIDLPKFSEVAAASEPGSEGSPASEVTSVEVSEAATASIEANGADAAVPLESREPESSPGEPSVATTGAEGTIATVLYIEDNLANLTLIKRFLDYWPDVELISAMQGRIGLEMAREHHPNLVILDLHLPDVNGEEILRELKLDSTTSDIPVVILSADATRGRMQRLLDFGASSYLTKPIGLAAFNEVMVSHVRQYVPEGMNINGSSQQNLGQDNGSAENDSAREPEETSA